jgi:FG-GAP-like repeat
MRPSLALFVRLVVLASAILIQSAPAQEVGRVRFVKQVLTGKYFCDGIVSGDLNRDGKADIVAGPFWYAGPDFKTSHEFYPAKGFPTGPSPTDSMFSYVYDFNGDGWLDILVLGRVHLHQAFWYENPQGQGGHWQKHFAFHRVQGESPPFLDVDGDNRPELVAHWLGRWGLIQPSWTEAGKEWRFKPITAPGEFHHFYHGTGIGDVNDDGRDDLLLNEGWYEQPADKSTEWTRHEFKFGNKGGAQMFALDVDGDGDNDVITALDAHGWGLAWFEHVREAGGIAFKKHIIMGSREEESKYGVAFSQPHALALADVDGDGLKDLVAGKRRWAHGPTGDIEPMADPVVYWFQLVREKDQARFVPHLIDKESGVGCQIAAADVNGDGRTDVLTASKLGAFAFLNLFLE